MKTLAILSQKGGTSKTSLCIHLSVEIERNGLAVALLDLDPQASAAGWADSRAADTPSVTPIPASRLTHALDTARRHGADVAVLDTAPHSADAAIAAAEAADLILIPCRPGVLDVRAISTTARIARLAVRPAFVVLTQVPPNAPRLAEDAIEAVRSHGLDVAPTIMHQRAAYAHALTLGQTAQEYEPEGKAAAEVRALYEWLSKVIKLAK